MNDPFNQQKNPTSMLLRNIVYAMLDISSSITLLRNLAHRCDAKPSLTTNQLAITDEPLQLPLLTRLFQSPDRTVTYGTVRYGTFICCINTHSTSPKQLFT
jgi:hypothetical protein